MTALELAADLMARRPDAYRTAIILGSGLGPLADDVENAVRVAYGDLPGFPVSGVSSHSGEVVLGTLAGLPVVLLSGRSHYYEHGDARAMATPIRALAALGCTTLILTNAAGSLRAEMPPGSLMAISDHINYSGMNPLIGETGDDRFLDMSEAYDADLRRRMLNIGADGGNPLFEGVYLWFSGPSFETPAEIRMARTLGADAVGMSTAPETILARHQGLRVAAISSITNYGAGMSDTILSHGQTKDVAAKGVDTFKALVTGLCGDLAHDQTESRTLAARALGLLDLTNLNDDCSEADIDALCTMAETRFGAVAAVCIWPRFVGQAKRLLAEKPVRIASVANFPDGDAETPKVVDAAVSMVGDGADEVDLVMPYRAYLSGRQDLAETQIRRVKEAIAGKAALKVIIETGELKDPEIIREASRMAISSGADFIKTSTGKVPINATPEAAETMLQAIAASQKPVGFKAAGGIRTAADAALYLDIAGRILGPDWARPETFRFGASGLLNALLADLEGAAEPESTSSY